MPWLPSISKYCVFRVLGALASANVYFMLTPSIGFCVTPLTDAGCGRPTTSSIVGTMSMQWCHCVRSSFLAAIPFGHEMTMPLRVPP